MKTPKLTFALLEKMFSKNTMARATQYGYGALCSPILVHHYKQVAKSSKTGDILNAAIRDYLEHEPEFRKLNEKL